MKGKLYPWQISLWKRFPKHKDEKRHHAYFLQGERGTGKLDFALYLAQYLLCSQASGDDSCQTCPSCTWFIEGYHPNFRLLSPTIKEQQTSFVVEDFIQSKTKKKENAPIISIDAIRDLADFFHQTSSQKNNNRIILIHSAESMNISASNSLLKMLEEPPTGVLFLLTSATPHKLPATILSRCHQLMLPQPSREMSLIWLKSQQVSHEEQRITQAGGSPLLALNFSDTILEDINDICKELATGADVSSFHLSELCNKLSMGDIVEILQKWLFDLLLCKFNFSPYYFYTHQKLLENLEKRLSFSALFHYQKMLIEFAKLASHPLYAPVQLQALFSQYSLLFEEKR